MKAARATRKDVAERAGVSTAVVSYVVNNGPRPVSASTRARVEAAIRELGYVPNELARSLRRQQSSTIGLVIPNLINPVYAEIAYSLESVCTEQGYLVVLCNTQRDHVQETKYIHLLQAKQVDGVVVIPNQAPRELIEPLLANRIPTVVLEHDLADVPSIAVDDLRGGWLGTQHLIEQGHRRIGLIRRTPTSATSSQRYTGYCRALAAAGLELDTALVVECGPGSAAGYMAMQRLLALADPPTAVFCHNDLLALGAMHAIRTAGLAIPEDVSVIGYDDTANTPYFCPPLTSVKFPKEAMGRVAADIILRLARRSSEPMSYPVLLPVELVVRASTAAPPAPTHKPRRS